MHLRGIVDPGELNFNPEIKRTTVDAVTTSGPSKSVMKCDFCGGNHPNGECGFELANTGIEEQVNYVGGAPRNFPNNNYYPGIRNHPNLSWHSPALQLPSQERKPAPWELAIEKLAQQTLILAQSTNSFMEETRANFKNQGTRIRNLEVQMGQIAKLISERPVGAFLSDTVPNPKEQCKAITLRSGKSLEEEPKKKSEELPINLASAEQEKEVTETPNVQPKVNISLPQLSGKEERHGEFEKFVRTFNSLFANTSSTMVWKSLHGFMFFMEFLSKKRKMKDDVFFLTYMTP